MLNWKQRDPLFRCVVTLTLLLTTTGFRAGGRPLINPLIFNVVVTNVTATTATITWSTAKPADSQVAYFIGSAKPTWSKCCNPSNTTSHSQILTGLVPNTAYNFFVESTPTGSSTPVDSAKSTFHTAAGFTISNVVATNVTSTSATITWTSSKPADTQVAYFIGSARPTWSACCKPVNVTSHSLTLNGLTSNTLYNFFVESTPTGSSTPVDSAKSTFHTLLPKTITVSVSPKTANTFTGGTTSSFTATLQNDLQDKGVTWTLSGSGCVGAACGTVSPASSASGAAVTYTSPANASAAGTVKLTATSVSNNSVSAAATITLTAPSATGPENLGPGSAPSTVVDSNGVVDIAWITQAGIVFAQSQDNGVTFSNPKLVLPLPAAAGAASIQVDAQNDIVIFTSYNATGTLGGNTAILARSTDGGKTFSNMVAQQNVFNSILLVQPSGVLDLAYTNSENGTDPDNALHESRSTDGGKTFVNDQFLWGAPIHSSDVVELRGAVGPQGQVYLTWTEQVDIPCEIHFIASLDGVNFQPFRMLTNTDVCNQNPTLVVDAAGNVNVAWVTGRNQIYFTRSTDQGQTFATPVVVNPSTELQNGLQFAVGPNGEIDLVFDAVPGFPESPAPSQVYLTRSLDHGATWFTAVNLSLANPIQNFTGAKDPHVGVDLSGKVTVAWEDDSNGHFSGDKDIYIRTSTDGATFTDPMDVSNTTDQIEISPTILETPNGVRYLTWYDINGQQSNPVLTVYFYAVQ